MALDPPGLDTGYDLAPSLYAYDLAKQLGMPLRAPIECPVTADKNTWLNDDTFPDSFSIRQEGTTVHVTRSDGGGTGWGMGLRIRQRLRQWTPSAPLDYAWTIQ